MNHNSFVNSCKLIILSIIFICIQLSSQTIKTKSKLDSLCGVKINFDSKNKILPRYFPDNIGKGYHEVVKLAAEFIKNSVPIEEITGKKLYYATCCFQGPHMGKSTEIIQGKSIAKLNTDATALKIVAEGWMHNPACVFAGFTQSLALDYFPYSGDTSYVKILGEMLDYQLKNGTTPNTFIWANVPYASSNPFDSLYYGATKWENEGMRGDGLHGIEPDKVGELGYAYLKYYQITMKEKYLQAALNCADALAKHIRNDVLPNNSPFEPTQTNKSPWPFRINARNGFVIDQYCANVVEPIKLLDELIRTKNELKLDTGRQKKYENTRKLAFEWLYSRNGPMKSYVWNAYFEDIPNDSKQSNRNQLTPMETARYLIKNENLVQDKEVDVPALIYYVKSAFGYQKIDAINEQTWCYEPMASHSARYASVCAMWYEKTKNIWFKEQAFRHFNYATYAVDAKGIAWVGHTWPGSWWSDGYGDYIKHYFDGIAAIPQWAPNDANHLIKSSSTVQKINYQPSSIRFQTYDNQGYVVLRLKSKPKNVKVSGKSLSEQKLLRDNNSYTWEYINKDGILRINYEGGNNIIINF